MILTWIALGILVAVEGSRVLARWKGRPLMVSELWGREYEYTEGRKGWRV